MSVGIWIVPAGLSTVGLFLWGATWLEDALIRRQPPNIQNDESDTTEGLARIGAESTDRG
jgi:hypothetical protein